MSDFDGVMAATPTLGWSRWKPDTTINSSGCVYGDDGKGMDSVVLSGRTPKGHYGLSGMQERAKLIGGKLTVWSELDMGTEVDLRVPANTAYTAVRTTSWLSRTFAGKTKARFRRPS